MNPKKSKSDRRRFRLPKCNLCWNEPAIPGEDACYTCMGIAPPVEDIYQNMYFDTSQYIISKFSAHSVSTVVTVSNALLADSDSLEIKWTVSM